MEIKPYTAPTRGKAQRVRGVSILARQQLSGNVRALVITHWISRFASGERNRATTALMPKAIHQASKPGLL